MTRALGAVFAILALAHHAAAQDGNVTDGNVTQAFAPTDDNLKLTIDGCLADPPTGAECATMGDWDTCGPASPDQPPARPLRVGC